MGGPNQDHQTQGDPGAVLAQVTYAVLRQPGVAVGGEGAREQEFDEQEEKKTNEKRKNKKKHAHKNEKKINKIVNTFQT